MMTTMFRKYRSAAMLLAGSALLVSCDRLVSPDFNTEVAELRGGA